MQISRNIVNGPKNRFWWNLGCRLHPDTISSLFADLSSTTHGLDCVPIVHFIRYNCLYFVCYVVDQRMRWLHCLHCQFP